MKPEFYVCLCQPGFENLLKSEVSFQLPELRPSFQKKGVITFKTEASKTFDFNSLIFAIWTGKVTQFLVPNSPEFKSSIRIHPEQEHWELSHSSMANEQELQIEINNTQAIQAIPVHSQKRIPFPGNIFPECIPTHSPSRAYLKWAEAHQYLKTNPLINQSILEIACSPGGGSLFFLEHGAHVIGIDPRLVDEQIQNHERFHFVNKMAKNFRKEDFPNHLPAPTLCAMDMNLEPIQALQEWAHVVKVFPSVKESWITLKLGKDQNIHEIFAYLEEIEKRDWNIVFKKQLRSNRKEFFIAVIRN